RRSGAVLSEFVLELSAELELALGLREVLALGQAAPDLLLHSVEFPVAVRQLTHDRPPRGLVVGLLLEVPALLQALQDHPREIQDPVGGDLHDGFPARTSSESGCRKSCSRTSAGSAATSAPISAASRTWIGLRASETTIWVWKP